MGILISSDDVRLPELDHKGPGGASTPYLSPERSLGGLTMLCRGINAVSGPCITTARIYPPPGLQNFTNVHCQE